MVSPGGGFSPGNRAWTSGTPSLLPRCIRRWTRIASASSGLLQRGHAICVGRVDWREKRVVSQVPSVDGVTNFRAIASRESGSALIKFLEADWLERYTAGASIVAVNILSCAATVANVQEAGGEAWGMMVNVADSQTTQRFSRVDILVDNAVVYGGLQLTPFKQMPEAEHSDVVKELLSEDVFDIPEKMV